MNVLRYTWITASGGKIRNMEQSNADKCSICGKSKAGQAGMSLTQWIFNSETCRCDSAPPPPPPEDLCVHCGKPKGADKTATMTQWIFRPELCSCDAEGSELQAARSRHATTHDTVQEPLGPEADLIEQLEMGEIDYHGLPPESFPFDRFRIFAERGRGASGVVYEAWDCLLKRRVAIKTMHATSITPEEVIRLQNEAKASSRLKHPAIIRILDFGAAKNGQPYLVSDFIDGKTLSDQLENTGPLQTADAVPIFIQVCAGIAHAHEQGVLHRDLKSSNVMISDADRSGNRVKIIDFGVARLREAMSNTSNNASTITLVGTPYYMSPEQGTGGAFDARSEVYSLGCMMFESMSGRVPFQGETALETMAMHNRDPVPELLEINPDSDCSEELEDLILHCLEKDPADRFQSISEVQENLQRIQVSLKPIETSKVPQLEKVPLAISEPTSKPTIAIAIGAVALVGFVVLGWVMLTGNEPPKPVPPKETAKQAKAKAKALKENWEDDTFFGKKTPFQEVVVGGGSFAGGLWVTDESFAEVGQRQRVVFIESTISPDVTGSGLKFVKDKPIRNLHLVSKSLTDEAFQHIAEMNELQFLTIGSAPNISDESWDILATMPDFVALRVIDQKLPADFLERLTKIPRLKALIMMEQPAGSPKTDWSPLARMPNLEALAILHYDFTDDDLKYIRGYKKLEDLRLSELGLSDHKINEMTSSQIKQLDLGYNKMTDKTFSSLLAGQNFLSDLDMSGCNVSAKCLASLKQKFPKCVIKQDKGEHADRLDWGVAAFLTRLDARGATNSIQK